MFSDDTTYAPLKLFEYDHKPGNYCLMLSDQHMVSVEEVFAEHGRDPGGYAWADVAVHVMRTTAPELEESVGLDPEAGTFVAYGSDLEALERLGGALHAAYHDPKKLGELVAKAPYEYD